MCLTCVTLSVMHLMMRRPGKKTLFGFLTPTPNKLESPTSQAHRCRASHLAPTADSRDSWHATLRHVALEGCCFVLGCNQFVTKDMYPPDLAGIDDLADQPEIVCRGGSAIISPLGDVWAGPLYDREGTLFADLDLAEVTRGKFDFDVVGHYARPDIFQLIVNERPMPPVDGKVYDG